MSALEKLLSELFKAEKEGFRVGTLCLKTTTVRSLCLQLGLPADTKQIWGVPVVGGYTDNMFDGYTEDPFVFRSRKVDLD